MVLTPSLIQRFWAKVAQSDGCWGWTGAQDEHGYGRIGSGGRRGAIVYAHRVSWAIHVGPVPDGLHVLHHCDTPPCSRPDHLFLGTQADNMRDMRTKGRGSAPPLHLGTDAAKAKLTLDLVSDIRRQHASGVGPTKLAMAFGVNKSTISRIVARRYWRDAG